MTAFLYPAYLIDEKLDDYLMMDINQSGLSRGMYLYLRYNCSLLVPAVNLNWLPWAIMFIIRKIECTLWL